MKIHKIKTLPVFFEASLKGVKPFEIRKNDRGYEVGDFVRLQEFDRGILTGREIVGEITYLIDYEQKDDYVVFSYKRIAKSNILSDLCLENKKDDLSKKKRKFLGTIFLYLILLTSMIFAIANLFEQIPLLIEYLFGVFIPAPMLMLVWLILVCLILGTILVFVSIDKIIELFLDWSTGKRESLDE